jgi:hypothetical protein
MAKNGRKKSSTKKNKSKNPGQSNKQMTIERNREIQRRLNEKEKLEVPSHLSVDDIKVIIAEVESLLENHILEKNQWLADYNESHKAFSKVGMAGTSIVSKNDANFSLHKSKRPFLQQMQERQQQLEDYSRRLKNHVASVDMQK